MFHIITNVFHSLCQCVFTFVIIFAQENFFISIVDLQCGINFFSKVSGSIIHIHTFFFILLSIMVCHKILDIVPLLYSRTLFFIILSIVFVSSNSSLSLPQHHLKPSNPVSLWLSVLVDKFICVLF